VLDDRTRGDRLLWEMAGGDDADRIWLGQVEKIVAPFEERDTFEVDQTVRDSRPFTDRVRTWIERRR
jgi:hypothetical protein